PGVETVRRQLNSHQSLGGRRGQQSQRAADHRATGFERCDVDLHHQPDAVGAAGHSVRIQHQHGIHPAGSSRRERRGEFRRADPEAEEVAPVGLCGASRFSHEGMPVSWPNQTIRPEEFAERRARMVEDQLRGRGISDERVLSAMGKVPRERFVAPEYAREAYADGPLPIGDGQTVSQPYMVAAMVEALEVHPSDRVLEVGTGTGYEASVLAELAAEVWTIERHRKLADQARQILLQLGYENVHVICGDGSLGMPEQAPFDKIVV